MIPPDRNQPGPPGRVTVWGHPWHGLVEAGTLTLPNSATMAYPAPGFAGEADVLAFQPPGTTSVARTPEQAGADTDAGRQWLDYALISGRYSRRLYGQIIGGNGTWLYAAPDGSRWLVTLSDVPGTHDLTTSWAATLTCARFGAFGVASETHEITATLADWQQAVPGHPGGDYHVGAVGEVTTATVEVEDVRIDGSQAVLMIGLETTDDRNGLHNPLLRRPLGFLTCTLTGVPGEAGTAALAVARSRETTLGVRAVSSTGSVESMYHDQALGTWHAGPGVDGDDMMAFVGDYAESGSISNRILAMVYAGGDTPADITLSTAYELSESNPAPPDGTSTITRTATATSIGNVTLSGPGGEVEIAMSQSMVVTSVFANPDPSTITPSVMTTTDESVTIGADTITSGGSFTTYPGGGVLLELGAAVGDQFGLGTGDDGYNNDFRVLDTDNNLGAGTITDRVLCVTRYSATAVDLTLAVYVQHVPGGPSGYEEFRYLGAIGRGAASGTISFAARHPYGSAHPVTGEIARARDVPVCWV